MSWCNDEMRKYILLSVNKIKLNDIVRHLCICTLNFEKKTIPFFAHHLHNMGVAIWET